MKTIHRGRWMGVVVGLVLAGLTGCQTWTYKSGMTLPSGHYLQHPPQYIPDTPDFPLTRELASQEAAGITAVAPAPAAPPLPGQ